MVNRALITKNYIIKSIPKERIKTYAYSDIKPRYDTNTDKNRRVDFIVLKCGQEFEKYDNFYSNYINDFLISLTNK
mgnify:FL=1